MPNTCKYRLVHQVIVRYILLSIYIFNHIGSLFLCQIWNWQLSECLKSILVPAYIVKRENQYLPTMNIDEGSHLSSVLYINSNDECLVLNYHEKSLCGLLMLKNYNLKLWYGESAVQNNIHPFPSFLDPIEDVSISSNQQLIAVKSKYKVSWFLFICCSLKNSYWLSLIVSISIYFFQ